jgi:predicted SnoaL-like aldol condensation-catalyzing enzyme
MEPNGQQLADTYLSMLNTHDPSLVDQFVGVEYRNHNAFVEDGREGNRTDVKGIGSSGPRSSQPFPI